MNIIDTIVPLKSICEQTPARMVAGALAHLARHMETGCQRSAYLAAMLLEQIANDAEADEHLRRHARELVEILDREGENGLSTYGTTDDRTVLASDAQRVLRGAL